MKPLYTLDEARIELRRLECESQGHDFQILTRLDQGDPERIVCSRCGESWRIEDDRL